MFVPLDRRDEPCCGILCRLIIRHKCSLLYRYLLYRGTFTVSVYSSHHRLLHSAARLSNNVALVAQQQQLWPVSQRSNSGLSFPHPTNKKARPNSRAYRAGSIFA